MGLWKSPLALGTLFVLLTSARPQVIGTPATKNGSTQHEFSFETMLGEMFEYTRGATRKPEYQPFRVYAETNSEPGSFASNFTDLLVQMGIMPSGDLAATTSIPAHPGEYLAPVQTKYEFNGPYRTWSWPHQGMNLAQALSCLRTKGYHGPWQRVLLQFLRRDPITRRGGTEMFYTFTPADRSRDRVRVGSTSQRIQVITSPWIGGHVVSGG